MKTRLSLATISDWLGREVGPSDWVTVTQERINQFADATGDHQWIHIDAGRAAKESPFGTTIAHGYLTVSYTHLDVYKRQALSLSG